METCRNAVCTYRGLYDMVYEASIGVKVVDVNDTGACVSWNMVFIFTTLSCHPRRSGNDDEIIKNNFLLTPMSLENVDADLWRQAKISNSNAGHISWFFFPDDPMSMRIQSFQVTQIQVTRRVFLELAIFDTMATFWENLPLAEETPSAILSSYHNILRRLVTTELQSSSKTPNILVESPPSLRPWLQRTLCLLGHDEDCRTIVETFQYPTQLLYEGAY